MSSETDLNMSTETDSDMSTETDSDMPSETDFRPLLQALEMGASREDIKNMLPKYSRKNLEKENVDHFNVMHFAIKAGHTEAVRLFFEENLFKNCQKEKDSWFPYYNYAAYLGNLEIMKLIDEEEDCIRRLEGDSFYSEEDPLDLGFSNPLKIAAFYKHFHCVTYLLEQFRYRCFMLCGHNISRAACFASSESVKYLLGVDNTITQKDIGEALDRALKARAPNCIKLLLDKCDDVPKALDGFNPYHKLYLYCSDHDISDTIDYSGGRLLSCTKLLISEGFDVNISEPNGSYPLYSLIDLINQIKGRAIQTKYMRENYMKAIECLLEAGADPHLREVQYFGRDSADDIFWHRPLRFDSAFHAVYETHTFDQFDKGRDVWNQTTDETLTELTKLIIKYGGNVQMYGEGPLQALITSTAMNHAQGFYFTPHLTIQTLLDNGAKVDGPVDPDDINFNDPNLIDSLNMIEVLGPIGVYFHWYMHHVRSIEGMAKWMNTSCPREIAQYFSKMDRRYGRATIEILLRDWSESDVMFLRCKEFQDHIYNLLSFYLEREKCLFTICAHKLHEYMGSRWDSVKKLPLHFTVKRCLNNLFPQIPKDHMYY